MNFAETGLKPRDAVKLAFQYQETEFVPYDLALYPQHEQALAEHFADEGWRDHQSIPSMVGNISGFDGFLSLAGMTPQPDGTEKDILGCSWRMGNIHHLEDGRILSLLGALISRLRICLALFPRSRGPTARRRVR
jgi:hypothetical protein